VLAAGQRFLWERQPLELAPEAWAPVLRRMTVVLAQAQMKAGTVARSSGR
jgi:hypothetical protein